MDARVEACTPCHGNKGEGTNDAYFPRLAGNPAGYLYNQLRAFRSGRREYPPMNYLLEFMPDSSSGYRGLFIRQPASAVAGKPDASKVSREVLLRGEAADEPRRSGRAARGLCQLSRSGANLHGARHPPGLLGLRSSYLSAQLGAWRYGHPAPPRPRHCNANRGGEVDRGRRRRSRPIFATLPASDKGAPYPREASCCHSPCGSAPKWRDAIMQRMRQIILVLLMSVLAAPALHAQQPATEGQSDLVARGEYLARAGDCIACHTAPEGRAFAGGPGHADAFRRPLYFEHHAGSDDRHRPMERRRLLYKTMHAGRFPR